MKRFGLISAGILLILVLAGAAFFGARLLTTNQEEIYAGGAGGTHALQFAGDGGNFFSLTIEPAPELPDRPAEVSGLFVRREDNSLFVGTGETNVTIQVDEASGQQSMTTDHSGPMLEVVVTQATTIYQDETDFNFEPSASQGNDHVVQQVVQPVDSLDDIGDNTDLQAWGQRRGDRLIAEVVVYRRMVGWVAGE